MSHILIWPGVIETEAWSSTSYLQAITYPIGYYGNKFFKIILMKFICGSWVGRSAVKHNEMQGQGIFNTREFIPYLQGVTSSKV